VDLKEIAWTELKWVRLGCSGGFFWIQQWNLALHIQNLHKDTADAFASLTPNTRPTSDVPALHKKLWEICIFIPAGLPLCFADIRSSLQL